MRDALKMYKEQECDGLIAIGGGSPMDLAKAVALMATHPGTSLQTYAMVEGGAAKITPKVAPIVAIDSMTTATAPASSAVSAGGSVAPGRPRNAVRPRRIRCLTFFGKPPGG